MKQFLNPVRAAALFLLLALVACAGVCEGGNPIIDPQEIVYTKTPQRYFNVLLAGIDLGVGNYLGSMGEEKVTIEDCHADAMLVVSLNLDTGGVNLISLPRDSVTYVPGVRGIYKLNGAVNCGETIGEGLERACAAASWLLGGVEVSHYCAVDMGTMIALGDAIGGVEFDMDMTYVGSSGIRYYMGKQTLDGVGIIDYLRARSNATREGSDIGRTGRQRELMLAIFSKVRENPSLLTTLLGVMQDERYTLLTNIGLSDIVKLAGAAMQIEPENIGSYVVTGVYGTRLDWSFTFTDQQARKDVIREAFGVEAEELAYVGGEYLTWLEERGLRTVRYIGASRQLLAHLERIVLSEEQQLRVDEFAAQLDRVIRCFEAAADSLDDAKTREMERMHSELRTMGEALIAQFGVDALTANYEPKIAWQMDARINEYQFYWQ